MKWRSEGKAKVAEPMPGESARDSERMEGATRLASDWSPTEDDIRTEGRWASQAFTGDVSGRIRKTRSGFEGAGERTG